MLDPTLSVNDVMGDTSPNLEDENLTARNMVLDGSNREIVQGFRHNALVVATFPWKSGIIMAPTWSNIFKKDHFAFVS